MIAESALESGYSGIFNDMKEQTDMDVPKITVFKSPPWHRPVAPVITPKMSDVYEEFPAKSKMLPKRMNMGMSRSLECIPENMVLQDTHKYSTTHLRDSNRLSPHQVLPPIRRYPDEELPEMRQRAHSDPHKYSTMIKKKQEERKDSPLVKFHSTAQPVPPKEKANESSQNHTVVSSHRKVQRRIGVREHQVVKTPPTTKSSPGTPISEVARHGSPVVAKPPHGFQTSKDDKIHHVIHRKKPLIDSHSNPAVPENRITRNKKLVSKNLSNDMIVTHPTVAALKLSSPSRVRTNSMPASLNKTKRKTSLTPPIKAAEGVKSTVAYALIGSPGRNRWPSPEREATSYINSDGSSSPRDSPTEERICESDSSETIHKSNLENETEHQPSQEFKTILQDLKSSRIEEINSIIDPEEYFMRASNWKTT